MGNTPHRDGPPPTFTESDWLTRFLAMVHIGMPAYLAAEACGVSRQTYFMWARKGGHSDFIESAGWIDPEDGDPLYVEFVQKLLEAEAGSLHKVTATVYQKAETDPEFGLKWLKHRHPEHWNPSRNTTPTVVVASGTDSTRGVMVSVPYEEYQRLQQERKDTHDE